MRKMLRAKLNAVKDELRRRTHDPIPEQGACLRSVLTGHFRYYGVPMNGPALRVVRLAVGWIWCRSLRRRSQRRRIDWLRMRRLVSSDYTTLLAIFGNGQGQRINKSLIPRPFPTFSQSPGHGPCGFESHLRHPKRSSNARDARHRRSGPQVGDVRKGDRGPGMSRFVQSLTRLSLRAFAMTETELKLMAAAATIGESNHPKNG